MVKWLLIKLSHLFALDSSCHYWPLLCGGYIISIAYSPVYHCNQLKNKNCIAFVRVFLIIPRSMRIFFILRLAPNERHNSDVLSSKPKETTNDIDNNNTVIENVGTASVWKLRKAVIRTLRSIYSCDLPNHDAEPLRGLMFKCERGKSNSGESWNNFTTCYIKLD